MAPFPRNTVLIRPSWSLHEHLGYHHPKNSPSRENQHENNLQCHPLQNSWPSRPPFGPPQGLWYVTCVKLWNIYMPLVVSRCPKFLVANGRFLGWWQSFMDLVLFRRFSNWWQLKHFVIFTPYILGVSWSQFDKSKSNHQLVIFRRCFFSTKKYTTPIWYANFPMGHFWYLTRSRGGTFFFGEIDGRKTSDMKPLARCARQLLCWETGSSEL